MSNSAPGIPRTLSVHEAIRRRRSPVGFSGRTVSPENIQMLFEAARWSASSYNEQPWRFLVVTRQQPEAYQRLLSAVNEGNRLWAGRAPVLIAAIAKTRFSGRDRENRHAVYDLGAAVASLSLQAIELDLYVHQMAGFSPERLREVAGIPEGYEPLTMAAVGYLDDGEDIPENLRARDASERTRRPLSEIVFGDRWEESIW